MKTWFNPKTGQRLPACGYGGSATLVTQGRHAGKRIETFIIGEGRRTQPLGAWVEQEIPDLKKGFTMGEYRAYAAAYGKFCAWQHIETCDYMKPHQHVIYTSPTMPCDGDLAWFESVFGASYRAFAMPIAAAFGVVAFDIVAFERHLAAKFGYPAATSPVSIETFMNQRFGEAETARFLMLAIAA